MLTFNRRIQNSADIALIILITIGVPVWITSGSGEEYLFAKHNSNLSLTNNRDRSKFLPELVYQIDLLQTLGFYQQFSHKSQFLFGHQASFSEQLDELRSRIEMFQSLLIDVSL